MAERFLKGWTFGTIQKNKYRIKDFKEQYKEFQSFELTESHAAIVRIVHVRWDVQKSSDNVGSVSDVYENFFGKLERIRLRRVWVARLKAGERTRSQPLKRWVSFCKEIGINQADEFETNGGPYDPPLGLSAKWPQKSGFVVLSSSLCFSWVDNRLWNIIIRLRKWSCAILHF